LGSLDQPVEARYTSEAATTSLSIVVLSLETTERLYYVDFFPSEAHYSFFISRLAGSGMVLNCL
jgi:hypothetical protein